jgi:hypothetical protein
MWARWVAWMDRREAATSLAIVRVALGLVVTLHVARMAWTGGDQWVWLDAAHGGLRALTLGPLEATPGNLRLVEGAAIVGGLLTVVGLYTRVGIALAWLAFGVLADANAHAGGSYDELVKNILFLLFWSGCGQALSLDAAVRGRTGLVTAWPRYLLVVQLVVMYASTGFQKVSNSWVPGGPADALWYILQQPTWQRADMTWLAPLFPLTQLATLGTWLFEAGSPALLLAFWFRDTRTRPGRLRALFNRLDARTLFVLAGLGMHFGIEATMEVGPFSPSAVALYACLLHPDEWARLARRLVRRDGAVTPSRASA